MDEKKLQGIDNVELDAVHPPKTMGPPRKANFAQRLATETDGLAMRGKLTSDEITAFLDLKNHKNPRNAASSRLGKQKSVAYASDLQSRDEASAAPANLGEASSVEPN